MTPGTRSQGAVASQSIGQMVLDAAQLRRGTALQYKRRGTATSISYAELGTISGEIARGLIGLGIEPGDRVAILGLTSADWTLAECGAFCAGAVVTPIYHTNSPAECAYVLRHSGARLVFCENAEQAAKIAEVRDRCPELEHVVLFESEDGDALTLDAVRRAGSQLPADAHLERLLTASPEDFATLVYTSGTSGPPKGCMLSHDNFLATARMYGEQVRVDSSASVFQFLPLAHVLARIVQMSALRAGARIVYWSGDARRIPEDLAEAGPTYFPSVPRIFEKVHGAAIGRVQEGPAPPRVLFGWAVRTGARARRSLRAGAQPRFLTDLQYRVARPLVLAKVREVFGPNLRLAMVGAAPIAKELLEFFDACGVLVLEGYGLTETCGAATLNVPDALRFGTVGRPLPGTEVAIAADGEILVRGPHVFMGYYDDPAATDEAFTADGWFRSGDLGSIDDHGFLTITGRKKELIITSSGKNIGPVPIEAVLRNTRYIGEAVVYGDRRPYLVAILTLDREEAATLARRLGIGTDLATIAADARVHAEIEKDVDLVNAQLARIERVKRFAILDHDLTQAAGELTPTLKIKRSVVYEKYEDTFAGLYADGAR